MTIEDLARAAYAAGHHALGNAPGTDGGSDEWPLLSDLTRRFYRAMACAVVREVAASFDVCGVHGEARGDLCEAWGCLTAEARVGVAGAPARKEDA